jgi:hypothetical protein
MKSPLSTVLKEMQNSSNKLKRLLMMQISMQQMINKLMKSLLNTVLKEMQNCSNKLKRLLMMQISMQQMINKRV